ncbi:MAG: molybdopterin-dependent oxidoreductase [Thermoplasmatota archaeon]
MKIRAKTLITAVLCIVLILMMAAGSLIYLLTGDSDDRGNMSGLDPGPIELGSVEVEEYNGTKLGSTEDFQENSIKGPQEVDIGSYTLNITGLVEEELSVSYGDLLTDFKHYRKVVTIKCVMGWSVTILWDGLLVRDLIDRADPMDSGKTLIFKAVDGYTTSLPIEFFYDNDILMAYGMNNVTLSPERGFPFQLVAEMKWGYKWIKWIDEIEVSDDIDYKGYWEERGFDNDADLDQ